MKQRLLLMLFGIMVFAVMGCESDSESDSALCGQTWKCENHGVSSTDHIATLLSKGAKLCKGFGTKHGEKIFKLGKKYYSFDNTKHNGGVYKVFEREGGNLKRIGTADENLNIFKK